MDGIHEDVGPAGRRLVHRPPLRGDLDWITMRALEKDRTRRYQTASSLAATAPRSYVSVDDVAAFAVHAVEPAGGANRDLHITGPEPLSALDAVRTAERVTGRTFRVQRRPPGVLRVLSFAFRPFCPATSSLMAMAAASSRADVVDMAPLLETFPVRLTTFEQYVRAAVGGG